MSFSTEPIDALSKDGRWIASFRYEPYLEKWFAIKPDTVANNVLLLDTVAIPNAIIKSAGIDDVKWEQNCYRTPIKVQIQTNQNYNYQCHVCYARSLKGKDIGNSLTIDELDILLSNLRNMGVLRVNFVGGEVFLRKDFKDIVELALSKRLLVSCITNGRIPGQKIEKYTELLAKFFNVQVSCNGIGNSYEEEYQTDNWGQASKSIVNVLQNTRANILSYVITENNFNDIPKFLSFAANEAKPHIVKFGSVCWSGKMSDSKAIRYYKVMLPIAKQHIESGRKQYPKLNIQSQLDLGSETPLWEDFANGYRPFEFYYSPDGRDCLYISSTGELFPFPLLSDRRTFYLGNARHDDIRTIWESHPMLKEIRDVTFEKTDCGKVNCKKVCGLWSASYAYAWSGRLTGKVPCELTAWQ